MLSLCSLSSRLFFMQFCPVCHFIWLKTCHVRYICDIYCDFRQVSVKSWVRIIINFLTDKKAPPRQSDGRRSVKNRVDQTRDFFSLTNFLGLTRSINYAMFWRTPVGLTNSLALAIYYQHITFILIHHDDDTIYSNNMNSSISCNAVSVPRYARGGLDAAAKNRTKILCRSRSRCYRTWC